MTAHATVRFYDGRTVDTAGNYNGRFILTVPPIDSGDWVSGNGYTNELDLVVEDPDDPDYVWDIGVYTSTAGSISDATVRGGFTFDSDAPSLWDAGYAFRLLKADWNGSWGYTFPYGGIYDGAWAGPLATNVNTDIDAASDARWNEEVPPPPPPTIGWVAIGNAFSLGTAYSTNGVDWTGATSPFSSSGNPNKVKWNGEYLLAVGRTTDGTTMAQSFDGITWSAVPCPADGDGGNLYSMDWSPERGVWLIAGYDADSEYIQFSGVPGDWTVRDLIPFHYPDPGQCIAWGDGRWLAGSGMPSPYPFLAQSFDDGATWDLVETPLDTITGNKWANAISYDNGVWVIGGGIEDFIAHTLRNVFYSDDLSTWHVPDTPWNGDGSYETNSGNIPIWAATVGRWYVGAWLTGVSNVALISSADLEEWRSEGFGSVGSSATVREHDGHFCVAYHGGVSESYTAKFLYSDDGDTWIDAGLTSTGRGASDFAYRVPPTAGGWRVGLRFGVS